MRFFQRFVKTSLQGFNLLALYLAISDCYSNPTSDASLDVISHGSALLSSLLYENDQLNLLSLITNGLNFSYYSYNRIMLNDFSLRLESNLFDNFIHLLNVAMVVTEGNRESETNGFFNSFSLRF